MIGKLTKILKTLARNEVLMFHFLLIVDLLFQVFLTLINFMVYQTIKTLISEMQNRYDPNRRLEKYNYAIFCTWGGYLKSLLPEVFRLEYSFGIFESKNTYRCCLQKPKNYSWLFKNRRNIR